MLHCSIYFVIVFCAVSIRIQLVVTVSVLTLHGHVALENDSPYNQTSLT